MANLDYIPSWLDGATTLLKKLNKCIEKIEELNDGKQAKLTDAQLAACNSGITAEKLTAVEGNKVYKHTINISGKVNNHAFDFNFILYNTSSTQITAAMIPVEILDYFVYGTYMSEQVLTFSAEHRDFCATDIRFEAILALTDVGIYFAHVEGIPSEFTVRDAVAAL